MFRHIRFVAAGNGRRYGMAMAIGCGDGRSAADSRSSRRLQNARQHGEARAERIAYKHWRLGKLLQAAMGVYIMAVGSVCRQAGHRGNRAGRVVGQFATPAKKASI